ncbi:hypothetical protein [Halobaculum sp. EA56]|uniref:hypothetical protein n=1 Tax=Halobaculum sp. EA56 TaxID=3421648 RepID=UPI003EC12C1D
MELAVDSAPSRSLLIGEERRLTAVAILAAVVLFVAAAAVEYTWISLCVQRRAGCYPNETLLFRVSNVLESGPHMWWYDEFLVVALAGLHAYFNRGYVPSLLLASAPQLGGLLFWIGGSVSDPALEFHPENAVVRFPLAVVLLASVGFVCGIGARALARRIRRGEAWPGFDAPSE